MRKNFFYEHRCSSTCSCLSNLPFTTYQLPCTNPEETRYSNLQKRYPSWTETGGVEPPGSLWTFYTGKSILFFFTCTATRLPVPIQASLLWLGQRHLRQQSGRAYRLKRHYQHRYITTGMALSESPLSGRIQGKWWADGQFEGRIPMKLNPKTKRE
jgi:hypothetical protein